MNTTQPCAIHANSPDCNPDLACPWRIDGAGFIGTPHAPEPVVDPVRCPECCGDPSCCTATAALARAEVAEREVARLKSILAVFEAAVDEHAARAALADPEPAEPCRKGCGPGYRYGDEGCSHHPEPPEPWFKAEVRVCDQCATPAVDEGLREAALAVLDPGPEGQHRTWCDTEAGAE
ncbi:hypothetical protein ACPPVT_07590 [Angustibacter sp. McL0619]|uniref:hypothetical protein n=1 Tax=Angustibacter sp. McL0619 TaxID=3415676 RepID=UPI003CEE5D76